MDSYELTPPIALHHLTGGLCLAFGENRLALLFPLADGDVRAFSVPPKVSVLSLMEGQENLRVLGRSRYAFADEMHDPVSRNFAISALSGNRHCLARTQFDHWSGVSTALHRAGRGADALLARRLTSQIRLCLGRLERLSIAYRTVLPFVLAKGQDGVFTSDKYAQHIGSEYRSLLNELYSLRDAVLACAYRLRYGCTDSFQMKKVKRCVAGDAGNAGRLIGLAMFSDEGDLLIDRMSLHRSIAQHCLGSNNPLFGDVYQLCISKGPYGRLPYLVYPLYDNIEAMRAIEQGSSKGLFEQPSETEARRFIGLPFHLDALEFCFDCFARLLRISEALSGEIGIAPERVTITDDDILEATVTGEDGKTRHFKRDPKTKALGEE